MDNTLRVTWFCATSVIYIMRHALPVDMIMYIFTYMEDGIDYLVANRHPQLLDSHVRIDKDILALLAFKHGWIELVKKHTLRGSKCAYILAIANDNVEAYKHILANDFWNEECTLHDIALRNRSLKILLSAPKHNGYESALAFYVKKGDVEAVKLFKNHMPRFAQLSKSEKYWRRGITIEDISFDMMKVVWDMYEFTPSMFIDRPHILAFLASKLEYIGDLTSQVATIIRFTKQQTIHYVGKEHKTLRNLAKTCHDIKWQTDWCPMSALMSSKHAKHIIQPSNVTLEMLHKAIKSGLYRYARLFLKYVRPTTYTIQLTRKSPKYNKLIRAVKAAAATDRARGRTTT